MILRNALLLPRAGARGISYRSPHRGFFNKTTNIRACTPPWSSFRREASTVSSRTLGSARALYQESPVQFSLALILIGTGAGFLSYGCYLYIRFIEPIDSKYPTPVAKKLKRALYYSNAEINPSKALAYYKQALEVADEKGMNPFSDEILGIKLAVAAMLEKVGQYSSSIEVLELMKADCWKWIDTLGEREEAKGDRSRIIGWITALNVRLAELNTSEYVDDVEQAEKNLIEGVETSLKEYERQEDEEAADENENPPLSKEAVGRSLEALGDHYERKSQHNLSAPLYLRALTLSPPPCHAVVLMNNLSISLAQSPPSNERTAPTSRPALISNAKSWAEKALTVAAEVKPPERNEECDIGCAVATHNLGEFAEMEGRYKEAEKRFHEAASLAYAIGFLDGVVNAQEGLARIRKRKGQ